MGVLVNRTLSSGVRTTLAMIAILSCSDLPTEPDALNTDDLSADEARVVATVEVTLGSSILKPGETTQATVILRDRYGNVLNRVVQWSSSDVTVATVSDSGLVTAIAPGVTQIIATRRTHVGSATLTVTTSTTDSTPPLPPPPATVPGTVSDLAVSAIETNSVTLSFAQVDDGTGKPANYDV